MTTPILVFDGDCAICTSCAEWVRRRVRTDVEIVPSQKIDFGALGLTSADVAKAAWWIDKNGRRYGANQAVGMTLRACAGWWSVPAWFFLVPPFSWLTAGGYRVVARYRHRLPGATPACRIAPGGKDG